MKSTMSGPITEAEKAFWTKLKVYFFCDADESLHWTDCAWLLFVGLAVLMGVVVTMV